MTRSFLPIALLSILFLTISCGVFRHSRENEEEEEHEGAGKFEPFDNFTFQRSYPDLDFDWKGWKNTMSKIKAKEAAKSKTADCSSHITDWTQQGPANVAGRCNTLAIKPDDENTVLAGFAGGGIFKTTDGGVNWRPVFDNHVQLCIGHIVFDPNNPQVAYAGTGDPNIPSIVFNGDGIYKSSDAGDTWQYLGLSEVGIISKITVHPSNPNILMVAAMGNPFVRTSQRGIYKSIDGGQHWQQVLFVSNQAGASDLVQSNINPDILYASFWDRLRSNTESILYGPNAKVFKSSDGGDTWTHVTGGLPTGVMGRTGLAMSRQNPDKVYVVYIDSLSTPGALYKTVNGGTSWESINIGALKDACGDFGWYFGKIRLAPANDEEIYFMAILMYRKNAGSSNWATAAGGHADAHDVVFSPSSGRRYWANDGGVYRHDPGQAYWTKCKNLPLTQFYHTSYNLHQPNLYYGGAQDNGVQKGAGGAGINSWTSVYAGDGFRAAFNPDDPQEFWVQLQNGTIHRTTNGGSSWQLGSVALGSGDRVSWDAPFFLSRFSPLRLYSATYRVYVSSGSGWGPISGDLTDGIIYSPRFHTVTTVQESPKLAEKLMAGTSDGNVWRREPTGNWINITGSLPDRYVTSVELSPTLTQRLFVTHSGFRNNEYVPHVHRSDDNGATWNDISGDLPQIPVNDLFVMPNQADSILFVATDAGVYFTRTSGVHWERLGGNMPVIPVFDLEENPVKKQLIAATYARGIWTFPLDSIFTQQAPVLVNASGHIRTEAGDGVNYVRFGTDVSQADGFYTVDSIPGCAADTLRPYRNDNPLNGLTTYDLVLISKHILGVEALDSPFKLIASDANRSNTVTTFDIVLLRKLILGIDTVLANNTSWRFVAKTHVFTNPLNPFNSPFPEFIPLQLGTGSVTMQDFTAIKIGDVNNSVVADASSIPSERTARMWPLSVEDRTFKAGEDFEVLFQGGMSSLAALQFTLKFDTTQLLFESLEPLAEGIGEDNFATNRSRQGLVSAAISDVKAASDESELFKITFRARKAGQLQQALQLATWPTPALAYRIDGFALLPELWHIGQNNNLSFSPNPVGESGTWLSFKTTDTGKKASETKLEIFDTQGRLAYTMPLSGTQRIFLGQEVFPNPGVYFWRLSTGQQSGKLIFAP